MHLRKIQVPHIPTVAPPEQPDFKGTAKASAPQAEGLFADPEFPATDESLGGITGDQANPQVAEYLAALPAV